MMRKSMVVVCFVCLLWSISTGQVSPEDLNAARDTAHVIFGRASSETPDPAGDFLAMADIIEKYPASAMGEILALGMEGMRGMMADPLMGSERVHRLLDIEELHGLTRECLRRMAWEEAARRGDRKACARYAAARWTLHQGWWAVGPFGDLARTFHGVVFPPESGPVDPGAVFKTRSGRMVSWRRLPARPDDFNMHLNLGSLDGQGCFYGVLHFKPERSGPAYLMLNGTASYEVWLNGGKCFDREREFSDNRDRFFLGVHLESGTNRLMVKTTDRDGSFFHVRLMDAQGLPIHTEVVEVPGSAGRPSGSPPDPIPVFQDAETVLTAAIRHEKNNPAFLALRSHLWSILGLRSLSLEDARKASALAPEEVGVQLLLVSAYTAASHLPRDMRRSRARALIRQVLTKQPMNLRARLWEVKFLEEDDRKEDAIRKLRTITHQFPDLYSAVDRLHSVYSGLGWEVESSRVLELLTRMAPGRTRWYRMLADRAARAGNHPRGIDLLEKALSVYPLSIDVLAALVRAYRRVGDIPEALGHLDTLEGLQPNTSTWKRQRAVLLSRAGRMEEARKVLEGMSACDEDPGETMKDLGDLARVSGNLSAAVQAYAAAVKQDPANHGTRRLVAHLQGKEAYPEFLPWRVDGLEAVRNFVMKKEFRSARTVLVLDHMVARYYPDGSSVFETHQVQRLNDMRGVQANREMKPDDEDLVVRVIQADGSVLIPARVGRTYTLPGLKPGVFIEHRSRTYNRQSSWEPLESLQFFFQSLDEPFLDSRIVFLMPENFRGRFVWRNISEPLQVPRKGGITAHVFSRKNQPKVVREAFMPDVEESIPWCELAEDVSWSALNRRLRNRMRFALRGSEEICTAARKIAEKTAGEAELARALYDHVQRIVTRGGSGSPTHTLLKRRGERLYLFGALLEAACIPFQMGYCRQIAPDLDPFPVPFFRTDDYFSQPLLRVRPRGGDPVWVVSGVPRFYPYGRVPEFLGGAPVFLFGRSGGMVDYLPEADLEAFASMNGTGTIHLGKGDGARGEFVLVFPSVVGFGLKESLRSTTRDVRTDFVRSIVSRSFRGATLVRHSLPGLEDRGAPLEMKVTLDFASFLRRRAGGKVCPIGLPLVNMKQGYARKKERVHPFIYRNYRVSRWKVVLDPGLHHSFPVLPVGLVIRRDFLTFGLSFSRSGNRIVVERTVVIQPGVLPAKEYVKLIEIATEVDDVESRMVKVTPQRKR